MKRQPSTILLLVAMAAALAAGCASSGTRSTATGPANATSAQPQPSTTPAASAVTVQLSEFAIAMSTTTVRAGKVSFRVTNVGQAPHEFVVLRTTAMAGMLPMTHGRATEAGHLGELGNLHAGQSKILTLQLPAGHYSAICNFPGHYHAGMHADFTAVAS
jgi:uncharacterized cupredoxin-like copper-binding protein